MQDKQMGRTVIRKRQRWETGIRGGFRGWEAYKGYGNACGEVNNWVPVDGSKILQVLQRG